MTAGVLVALIAVAAIVGSMPCTGASIRVALLETRAGNSESDAVRAVAAAMTAAVRELAGDSRIAAAVPSELAIVIDDLSLAATSAQPAQWTDQTRRMDVRLLDMPPPAC